MWTLEELKHATVVCLMAVAVMLFWVGVFLFFARGCSAEEIPVEILTIAYEASGESLEGQVAVASVIKTRMAERKQTAKAVCLAPKQFSCWKEGKPAQVRVLTTSELDRATKAWLEAKKGMFNHYCHYKSKPKWIKSAKGEKRVGNHIFYKL